MADAPLLPTTELQPVPGSARGRGRVRADLTSLFDPPTRRRAAVLRRALRRQARRLRERRRLIAIVLLSLTFSLLAAGMIARGETAGADARAYWAGVRIWLFPAPTVLHAKHFTIDDEVAVIGSSNMDMRSFSLNLEISVMVRSKAFVEDMRELEESYRSASRELTLDEWMNRPRGSAILDNIMRLTSAVQ